MYEYNQRLREIDIWAGLRQVVLTRQSQENELDEEKSIRKYPEEQKPSLTELEPPQPLQAHTS